LLSPRVPIAPTPSRRSLPRGDQRRARLGGGAAALLLAFAVVLGLGLWAFWLEPRRLVVHAETLDVPHWPAGAQGLRVALLSDLHVGSPYWSLERLDELVSEINRQDPELVLLAGDYLINGVKFGKWVDPESIAAALSRLRAPLGVVAVLGNHDWWNDGRRVRRALTSRGIIVLENEAHAIERGNTRFFVVGLADELTRRVELSKAVAAVPAGEPFIVLAHEPDIFPRVPEGAALTLAGHTHGGQVKLPLLGRIVVPSDYGQRYAAGHVVENGRHLFVTTGVGTSVFPVRFGVPPEIALLTLE
jgi:predicted MPP superfamily phosphohydrolase